MLNWRIWVKYLQKTIQYLHQILVDAKKYFCFLQGFIIPVYAKRIQQKFLRSHHKLFRKLNSGRVKIYILISHQNTFLERVQFRATRRGCWWRCCCWCSKWWTPWIVDEYFAWTWKKSEIKINLTCSWYRLSLFLILEHRIEWNIKSQEGSELDHPQ